MRFTKDEIPLNSGYFGVNELHGSLHTPNSTDKDSGCSGLLRAVPPIKKPSTALPYVYFAMISAYPPPQKLVFVFIALCITQLALVQADTVQCRTSFGLDSKGNAACRDSASNSWTCGKSSCGNNHHLYAPMKRCKYGSTPGVSEQQCSRYLQRSDGTYQCTNSANKTYICPYNVSNVPFITCSDCTKNSCFGPTC